MTPKTQPRGINVSRALALIAVGGLAACSSGARRSQDALRASVGRSSQVEIRAPDAGSRMRVAMAAEASGQPDVAVSMFAAAASASPSDMEAQARYASALGRNGRMDEAEQVLVRALARRPRDPALLVAIGQLRVRKGSAAEAVEALDQALAQLPRDIAALNARGVALDLMGRHAEAQQSYRTAQAVDPANIPSSNNLAFSLMLSGQSSEAVAILSELRHRSGAPARVSNNLGIAQAVTGDARASQVTLEGRLDSEDVRRIVDDLASGRQARLPDEMLGETPARPASQGTAPTDGARRDLAEAGSVGRQGMLPAVPLQAASEPALAPAAAMPFAFAPAVTTMPAEAPAARRPLLVAQPQAARVVTAAVVVPQDVARSVVPAPAVVKPVQVDHVVAGSVVSPTAVEAQVETGFVVVAGSVRPEAAVTETPGAAQGAVFASRVATDVQTPVRPTRQRADQLAVRPVEARPDAPPPSPVALAGGVPATEARCTADQLITRSGTHATFGRIVFDWQVTAGYDVRTDADGLSLRFRGVSCTPAISQVNLPRNVVAIRPDADGGFRIETAPGTRIRHFRLDRRIVIDAIDVGGPPVTRVAPIIDVPAMTLTSVSAPEQGR